LFWREELKRATRTVGRRSVGGNPLISLICSTATAGQSPYRWAAIASRSAYVPATPPTRACEIGAASILSAPLIGYGIYKCTRYMQEAHMRKLARENLLPGPEVIGPG
jgi:hypothetical protein